MHRVGISPYQCPERPGQCLHDHLISVVDEEGTDPKGTTRIPSATSGLHV